MCSSCVYYYYSTNGFMSGSLLPSGTFGSDHSITVDHSTPYNYGYRPTANRQDKLVTLFLRRYWRGAVELHGLL